MSSPNHSSKLQVWEAPDKSFTKTVLAKGFGFNTPQDGSVCKVRVFSGGESLVTGIDENSVKEIIIGDMDSEIDRIIEACVRTMKEEEICELLLFPHLLLNEKQVGHKSLTVQSENKSPSENGNVEVHSDEGNFSDSTEPGCQSSGEQGDINQVQREELNATDLKELEEHLDSPNEKEDIKIEESKSEIPITMKLQLLCFSREPEIWEMSITEKWRRASYHKDRGVELYAKNHYKWAFRRFSLALRYLISLEHDIPPEHINEDEMNIKGLKFLCYLNLAACQMKNANYESVVKNCTKALQLQPDNCKALFRRGTAFIHLQEYERAQGDLEKAHEIEPQNPCITQQQQLLKARVQKLNDYYASAMKKLFT